MSSLTPRIPFADDLNLGAAYNREMATIPDGEHACFIDHDVCFLSPNSIPIIRKCAKAYPHAVLTCYASRINPAAKQQLLNGKLSVAKKYEDEIQIAREREKDTSLSRIQRDCISGFLMCFSKELWKKYPFPETGGCLGVDSKWSKTLHRNGVPIYRINGLYVWHTYRLENGIENKSHLIPAV